MVTPPCCRWCGRDLTIVHGPYSYCIRCDRVDAQRRHACGYVIRPPQSENVNPSEAE